MDKVRDYCIKHWQEYDIVDSKEDFIKLLNILEAHGENLDTMANAVINGGEFCRYMEAYPTYREEAQFLLNEHVVFLDVADFGAWLTEELEWAKEDGADDWDEFGEDFFKREYIDGEFLDTMIEKTHDGYVVAKFC